MLQVAKTEQMRSVIFAICNEEEYIDELRKLDMADANEDIKVAAFNSGLKFRMDPTDDLQYEELKKFVTDFTGGKLRNVLTQSINYFELDQNFFLVT